MIQNRDLLIRVLKGIAENSKNVENKVFAMALLYLINEVIPKDRTTNNVISDTASNEGQDMKILTLYYVWMYGEEFRSWQLSAVLMVGTILLIPLWIIYGFICGIYKILKNILKFVIFVIKN